MQVVSDVSFFLFQVAFSSIHSRIYTMHNDWVGVSPKGPTQSWGLASPHPSASAFVQRCTCPTRSRLAGRLFTPAHHSRPSSHPHPGVTMFFLPTKANSFTQGWQRSLQGPELNENTGWRSQRPPPPLMDSDPHVL